jgi:group I intron endonuclease
MRSLEHKDSCKTGIYQIRNLINNKLYIGSSKNIYFRTRRHLADLRNNQHKNQHLQNSFNKYEEENFEFTILEVCEKDLLLERENYWMNTLNPKYNKVSYKDNLRVEISESTKLKISKSMKEKFKRGESTLPDNRKNRILIDRYDLEGNYIDTHLGLKETCRKFDLYSASIIACCKGKLKTSHGFIWKYNTSTGPV